MYSPPIIQDCLPTFGQVINPMLEEIRRFGCEEFVKPILELSIVVEGNSTQIVGKRAEEVVIQWSKDWRVGWMWKNLPVEFSEWPLSSCLQCVVGHCHAEESLHVVDPGVFGGFLPPDGEVVDNSIQQ
jgi:hypothetical protein